MEGEQLPSVEVEAALKKVTKELGAPVKTVKIKLHPRSLEDHILLRKIVGTARGTLFFEPECSLHRTVHVIPTIVLRVKQQLTH